MVRNFWHEVFGLEFLLPGVPAAAPAPALGAVPAMISAAALLVAATAAPAAVVVFRRQLFCSQWRLALVEWAISSLQANHRTNVLST